MANLTTNINGKKHRNFFISVTTGRLVFINPRVHKSKNGSRKQKHSKNG